MEKRTITPIGFIRSDFKEKFGIPRQSGRAPSLLCKLVFEKEYRIREAIRGIEDFSHLWILFDFSLTREKGWSLTVRPPRLGGNKRVGVFASRSPFRPNHIGLSCVKLERIEQTDEGDILILSGADILDGTPVYDIKPYLPIADCIPTARGGYSDEHEHHKLAVRFENGLENAIPKEKINALTECLADDPRPAYENDPQKIYGMSFAGLEIRFRVENGELTVVSVTSNS